MRRWLWMLTAILALSCSVVLAACANSKATAGNGLQSVSIASTDSQVSKDGKVAEIKSRGTLLVGTTGDYRPLSFRESDGSYWGFGIEVAKASETKTKQRGVYSLSGQRLGDTAEGLQKGVYVVDGRKVVIK